MHTDKSFENVCAHLRMLVKVHLHTYAGPVWAGILQLFVCTRLGGRLIYKPSFVPVATSWY